MLVLLPSTIMNTLGGVMVGFIYGSHGASSYPKTSQNIQPLDIYTPHPAGTPAPWTHFY